MHETDIPFIDQYNIDMLITEFLSEVTHRHGEHTELKMLIVGGSALAIKHGFRGTVDIDSEIRCRHPVKDCIESAAEKLGIPKDFINENFMKSSSYSRHLWDNAVIVKQYGNISVYVVSDTDQLCMKMVSARNKDIKDMLLLAEKAVRAGIRFSDVEARIQELYKGTVRINGGLLRRGKAYFRSSSML